MKLDPSQHEDFNFPIDKFETMLKTNEVLFFDLSEFENIVGHYMDTGKMTLAKKALKLGLDQHPIAVNLLLLKAELFILENHLEQANDLLLELKSIEPNNDDISLMIANVLSKLDKHDEAISVLNESLTIASEPADVYAMLGMEYLFVENFNAAKEAYIQCVKLDKSDYTALYNVIYCFDFLDQKEEAIHFLNNFINQNPYSEIAWHQLGKLYFEDQNYAKALEAFDFAIISDEYFIGAYIEKAKVLERQKKYKEAIVIYQFTLQLDDPTAFVYLRIGKCHEALGDKKKALKNYKQAIHEDPLMDKVWLVLSEFYVKEETFSNAYYYINKAINIDEENVLYWKQLAFIAQRLNKLEESSYALKRCLELGNFEYETWLTRIDLLAKMNQFDLALMTITEALDFFPDDFKLIYRRAGLLFYIGEQDKAFSHLEKALQLHTNYVLLSQGLFPRLFEEDRAMALLKKYFKDQTE
ncbi:MAG: tetratricopeptide repeat protein [Psychroflexus sp.]|nr:tetratricopeptide repeat protein [Psychroflexus sp.]MDN6310643.1 tetratricopeptide repeat protein [Psychroflexus sp.]